MAEQIICIFCGKQADVMDKRESTMVICKHCKRETEVDEYQEIFNQWLGDIRKEKAAQKNNNKRKREGT